MLIVIPMGLLHPVNNMRSVGAFQQLIYQETGIQLTRDQLNAIMQKTLLADKLQKSGQIDKDQFINSVCGFIKEELRLESFTLTEESFNHAWCASLPEVEKIDEILEQLREQGHQVVLVSGTNEIHFDYIVSKLKEPLIKVNADQEDIDIPDSGTLVFLSYHLKKSQVELYQHALELLQSYKPLAVLKDPTQEAIPQVRDNQSKVYEETKSFCEMLGVQHITVGSKGEGSISERILAATEEFKSAVNLNYYCPCFRWATLAPKLGGHHFHLRMVRPEIQAGV